MTSDSDRYIQLQQVYREQADIDDAIVTQKVHDLLQSIGRVSMIIHHMTLKRRIVNPVHQIRSNRVILEIIFYIFADKNTL